MTRSSDDEKYNVVVVGIGAVGTEMVRLLRARNFPVSNLTIFARSERAEVIDGISYPVKVGAPDAFAGVDFAFFAGTEGAKGASQTLGWEAVKRGCIVIDNGDDFRMDPRVPLVIPEINADALKEHQGFIANPNCSTIIALMPLAPLHKAAKIRRSLAGASHRAFEVQVFSSGFLCKMNFFKFNSKVWRLYEIKSRRGKATNIRMTSCRIGLLIKFVRNSRAPEMACEIDKHNTKLWRYM